MPPPGNSILRYFSPVAKKEKSVEEPHNKENKPQTSPSTSFVSPCSTSSGKKRGRESSSGDGDASRVRRRRIARALESSDESADEFVPDEDDRRQAKEDENEDQQMQSEDEEDQEEESVKTKKKVANNIRTPSSSSKTSRSASNKSALATPKSSNKSLPVASMVANRCEDDFPHLHFKFLLPENIRDANKKRPGEEGYNPRTLFVPEAFLNDLTPAQRQWWELKSANFDAMLFFKMGKFYELFHMDAVTAVNVCDLIYMKKEMAHCGFPEAAFRRYADVLVDKGYRVVRIEQVETPKQAEERCSKLKKVTKFDKVVRREVCQKVSLGTRVHSEHNYSESKDCYLLAILDKVDAKDEFHYDIGLCVANVTMGKVYFGQMNGTVDSVALKIRSLLVYLEHWELLQPERFGGHSNRVKKILAGFEARRRNFIEYPSEAQQVANMMLNDYFKEENAELYQEEQTIPEEILKCLDEDKTVKQEHELAFCCLGAVTIYLRDSLIDKEVILFKDFLPLASLSPVLQSMGGRKTVSFYGDTCRNLDLLPSHSNGGHFNLLSVMDRTSSPGFGKRLLRHWICNPPLSIPAIKERQEAIDYLRERSHLAEETRSFLKKCPDFDRLLPRLFSGCVKSDEHPDSSAVFYDRGAASKANFNRMGLCLRAFEQALKLQTSFESEKNLPVLLQELMKNSFWMQVKERITASQAFADFEKASEEGTFSSRRGVDPDLDRLQDERASLQSDLESYRKMQSRYFGCDVKLWGTGSNQYQLEVEENAAKRKVSEEYTFSSQKRGYKRYVTEEILDFRRRHDELEEAQREALKEARARILRIFCRDKLIWQHISHKLAVLDCLLSLAIYSQELGCDGVRPEFEESDQPFIDVVEGRHALMIANAADTFIPNDVKLTDNKAIVLTGANMGGKSTVLRQTALLVVLAHLGSHVPAQSMRLSPVDAILTRMGGADRLSKGESSFMVEAKETASILRHASQHSLIVLDELGRGTSSIDGSSLAKAVMDYILKRVKCPRTLLSTHHHDVVTHFEQSELVNICHMAMMDDPLTFLYKLKAGPYCMAHGFAAAQKAGIPNSVVNLAQRVAKQWSLNRSD